MFSWIFFIYIDKIRAKFLNWTSGNGKDTEPIERNVIDID